MEKIKLMGRKIVFLNKEMKMFLKVGMEIFLELSQNLFLKVKEKIEQKEGGDLVVTSKMVNVIARPELESVNLIIQSFLIVAERFAFTNKHVVTNIIAFIFILKDKEKMPGSKTRENLLMFVTSHRMVILA